MDEIKGGIFERKGLERVRDLEAKVLRELTSRSQNLHRFFWQGFVDVKAYYLRVGKVLSHFACPDARAAGNIQHTARLLQGGTIEAASRQFEEMVLEVQSASLLFVFRKDIGGVGKDAAATQPGPALGADRKLRLHCCWSFAPEEETHVQNPPHGCHARGVGAAGEMPVAARHLLCHIWARHNAQATECGMKTPPENVESGCPLLNASGWLEKRRTSA